MCSRRYRDIPWRPRRRILPAAAQLVIKRSDMDDVLLGIVLQRLKVSPLEEQATDLLLAAFESEEACRRSSAARLRRGPPVTRQSRPRLSLRVPTCGRSRSAASGDREARDPEPAVRSRADRGRRPQRQREVQLRRGAGGAAHRGAATVGEAVRGLVQGWRNMHQPDHAEITAEFLVQDAGPAVVQRTWPDRADFAGRRCSHRLRRRRGLAWSGSGGPSRLPTTARSCRMANSRRSSAAPRACMSCLPRSSAWRISPRRPGWHGTQRSGQSKEFAGPARPPRRCRRAGRRSLGAARCRRPGGSRAVPDRGGGRVHRGDLAAAASRRARPRRDRSSIGAGGDATSGIRRPRFVPPRCGVGACPRRARRCLPAAMSAGRSSDRRLPLSATSGGTPGWRDHAVGR